MPVLNVKPLLAVNRPLLVMVPKVTLEVVLMACGVDSVKVVPEVPMLISLVVPWMVMAPVWLLTELTPPAPVQVWKLGALPVVATKH